MPRACSGARSVNLAVHEGAGGNLGRRGGAGAARGQPVPAHRADGGAVQRVGRRPTGLCRAASGTSRSMPSTAALLRRRRCVPCMRDIPPTRARLCAVCRLLCAVRACTLLSAEGPRAWAEHSNGPTALRVKSRTKPCDVQRRTRPHAVTVTPRLRLQRGSRAAARWWRRLRAVGEAVEETAHAVRASPQAEHFEMNSNRGVRCFL